MKYTLTLVFCLLLTACTPAENMLTGLVAIGQGVGERTYVSEDAAYAFDYAADALVQLSEDASQPYAIVYVQFAVTDTAAYQGASIMTIMTPTADAAAYAASGADARVEFIPGRAGSGLAYRIGLYGGGKGGEVEPSPQARAQFEHLLATFRLLDQPLRARAVRVPAASSAVDPLVAAAFGYPLRDADGVRYGVPEGYIENRTHMEHLGYAVRNLDQWRIKCFDVDWSRMLHAGEDWYRLDLANTAGAPVYAVADGVVVQHNPGLNYPGNVVVIRHRLPDGSDVYSMYGHVANVRVVVGDRVTLGEQIATIFDQGYRGRTPGLHAAWDSHLHFEIRRRELMGNIYEAGTNAYGFDFPKCTWLYPGRGYTLRVNPNDYPYPNDGYLEPSTFIAERLPKESAPAAPGARVLLPLVQQPREITCTNVLADGGFEGDAGWAGVANTAGAVYTERIHSADRAYSGARSGRVGSPVVNGYWNEILQTTEPLPPAVISATLRFRRYLDTRETSTRVVYDAFRAGLETDHGVELAPPLRIDNTSPGRGEWLQVEMRIEDAAALSGRRVWVTFKGATDAALPSSLYVDDVELEVCVDPGK